MKKRNYKVMLLGIAVMLLGLCCAVQWGNGAYFFSTITEIIAAFAPYIGFIIFVIGYIFIDVE